MRGFADLTNTYAYLRNSILPWKERIKQQNGNKCCLTGSKHNLHVHHLNKSFKQLMNEAFELSNLTFHPELSHFTQDEISLVIKNLLELHSDVKAILIKADLHKRFHSEYGYSGSTEEDFLEFKRRYKRQYRESKNNTYKVS